jgi:hypothetical protein
VLQKRMWICPLASALRRMSVIFEHGSSTAALPLSGPACMQLM